MFGQGDRTQSAESNKSLRIARGVKLGFLLRSRATVPETIGVAMEVPLRVWYPSLSHVEKMSVPGAMRP